MFHPWGTTHDMLFIPLRVFVLFWRNFFLFPCFWIGLRSAGVRHLSLTPSSHSCPCPCLCPCPNSNPPSPSPPGGYEVTKTQIWSVAAESVDTESVAADSVAAESLKVGEIDWTRDGATEPTVQYTGAMKHSIYAFTSADWLKRPQLKNEVLPQFLPPAL